MAEVGDFSYREKIRRTVKLAALAVSPKKQLGGVLKALHGSIFVQRGVRNVVDHEGCNADTKVILLSPEACPHTATEIPEEIKAKLGGFSDCALNLVHKEVELTYKNFTMPEMLTELLPNKCVALSGFEQVGHIAHVNLSADHLPFKFVIGQVLIDCNPSITIVVNKVESISSVFREFKMEIIGGKNDTKLLNAKVKQHKFIFNVPYDKVYWNSRLQGEHERLITKMNAGDQLFDVMAGIGPFALPAASNGIEVHANDLNPASYEALKLNATENNLKSIVAYNMDGRDFIDNFVRPNYLEKNLMPVGRRHFAMNLPDLAVTFLDVFARPSFQTGKVVDRNFVVHVYTFSAAEKNDVLTDAVKQVEANLGCELPSDCVEDTFLVRDVAPKKQMVCVSFRVPPTMFEPEETNQPKKAKI